MRRINRINKIKIYPSKQDTLDQTYSTSEYMNIRNYETGIIKKNVSFLHLVQ